MKVVDRRQFVWAAAMLFAATGAGAQGSAWSPFVSVTPVYQGKADLDGGGEVSAWSAIVRAGFIGTIDGGHRAGITLNFDHTDYSFSNPAAFGGTAPWGTVQRVGMAAPLAFALDGGYSLAIAPSVDWIMEKGADSGDALTWGAVVTATRRFADGNRLGIGFGAFDRLDETKFFPLFIVDWKLDDRWRLTNPLPAGPTGPAGLEIDYRFDGGWNLGLGAASRSTRFRLSETGRVAGGVGEERGVPVFLRATRSFGPAMQLNLYAGVVTGGELRIEDATGQLVRKVDFGSAPLLGATFSARF
jgi:hypothetical protein